MKQDIGKVFYNISQIIAYILAAILIYQIVNILLGGSWEIEQVILALVIFNLTITFSIGGYLLHVNTNLNNKISKVDAKLTGHFGWHKGKEEPNKITD